MCSWTASEVIASNSPLEAAPFTCTGNVYAFTDSKLIYFDNIAFCHAGCLRTEFTYEPEWRQVIALEMTKLSCRKAL
jgi:hypothetical protein